MTLTRTHIEAIVMRVQNAFLAAPALKLNLPEAARRFDLDIATCSEILETLLGAGVLTKTPEGGYARLYPRPFSHGTGTRGRAA